MADPLVETYRESLRLCEEAKARIGVERDRHRDALRDFIATVSAPAGRLRMEGHRDGDVLYEAVKTARARLEAQC